MGLCGQQKKTGHRAAGTLPTQLNGQRQIDAKQLQEDQQTHRKTQRNSEACSGRKTKDNQAMFLECSWGPPQTDALLPHALQAATWRSECSTPLKRRDHDRTRARIKARTLGTEGADAAPTLSCEWVQMSACQKNGASNERGPVAAPLCVKERENEQKGKEGRRRENADIPKFRLERTDNSD